ncbi:MAG: hypothetical protein GY807_06895 [Gammaproteobacteria bacterium]|nr:hypothetical protein [Gammaproteobacteria bacterium]
MAETTSYTFKIDDLTPEDMPFGRLVEYYAEIKKMLGVADNLHLLGVYSGSHGSTFAIDRNHESDLVKRLIALKDENAPKPALAARDNINSMLREDGTSGIFYDAHNRNVVHFPGKHAEDTTQVRIRDAASITGRLYYIAGSADGAKVRVQTETYGVVFCTTTIGIVKAMRDFFMEEVKINGRGMWTKTGEGGWSIDDFTITDFAPVKRENLRQAVDQIRELGIDWPEDPLARIDEIEKNGGQFH